LSLKDRLKLGLFFLCALAVFFLLQAGYGALSTLSRLELVEAQRDQWQQPAAVLNELQLDSRSIVADIGCGSGYFTVRISPQVSSGKVLAEDIRRLPLVFLWIRAFQKGRRNITVVLGTPDDPHLPEVRVDAVLIANTYHEFTSSGPVLKRVLRSLAPGGRLVIVDRWPRVAQTDSAQAETEHEIAPDRVANDLRDSGFEIIKRRDDFIPSDPGQEKWWLIVAGKA